MNVMFWGIVSFIVWKIVDVARFHENWTYLRLCIGSYLHFLTKEQCMTILCNCMLLIGFRCVTVVLLCLFVFMQGIGNTFQGAANCIMFVLCTRPVRTRLVAWLCCRSHNTQSNSGVPSQYTAHTHTLSHTDGPSVSHIRVDESEDEE